MSVKQGIYYCAEKKDAEVLGKDRLYKVILGTESTMGSAGGGFGFKYPRVTEGEVKGINGSISCIISFIK